MECPEVLIDVLENQLKRLNDDAPTAEKEVRI